ncbi:MAG: PKD domain-containing protein, partial [Pedobacter sp.]
MKKLYKLLQLPYIIWLKNALLLFSILLFPTVLHAQCKAGFKYTVNGGKVKFGSTSTTTSGFPLKYQWSFDKDEYYYSGSDSAGWTYYDSDTYEVTLVVVDSAGNCRDTFTNDVIINVPDICDAGFTASVYNNNYPAAYFDATGAYRPRIKYIWSFGDGITDTLSANTMHEYYNGGTYNVCLVVWNTKTGCRDTTCKNVIIPTINKTNCKAEFYTNDSYAPGSIKFWSLSDCQTKHFWDFGDGYTSNEINPLHKFPKSGSYAVTLIAYGNALTLPDTIQKTVIFSGTGYCDAEFNYFNFENQFYINFPRLQATKFRLDFGDGTIITSPDKESDSVFMHTYKKKGTYIICLLKTDTNYNCSDTVCKTVTVKDPVYCYAGFSAYFDQNSRSVYLQNDTVFTGLSTALFSWDFGDGTSASGIGSYYTN